MPAFPIAALPGRPDYEAPVDWSGRKRSSRTALAAGSKRSAIPNSSINALRAAPQNVSHLLGDRLGCGLNQLRVAFWVEYELIEAEVPECECKNNDNCTIQSLTRVMPLTISTVEITVERKTVGVQHRLCD